MQLRLAGSSKCPTSALCSHNAGTKQNQVRASSSECVCVARGAGRLTHRSKGLLGTVTSEQSHTQFKVNTISVAASSVCSWALWEPEMKQCLKRLHRLGLPVLSFVLGLSGHMPFHLVYFIIVYQSVSGKWVTKSILLQVETFSYNLSAAGKVFSGIEGTMKP